MCKRLCDTALGNASNSKLATSHDSHCKGLTRSGHASGIASTVSPQPPVQSKEPIRCTNPNAPQHARIRPSTRTPCTCWPTRRALAQLPRALVGRAFAPAMPCNDTHPYLTIKVRLVGVLAPETASWRRWCRGRHRLNVEPARMHGAFSGQAGTCDGRKESLRLLQQARSTRGARGSPDRLGRGEGREEGEGGA
jgi:hypothetical protein